MPKSKNLDHKVKQTKLYLLRDLNEVVNLCIGNQDPVDVAVGEIDTLPELLAYVENNPRNIKRVQEAIEQLDKVKLKISSMQESLKLWQKMIEYLNK